MEPALRHSARHSVFIEFTETYTSTSLHNSSVDFAIDFRYAIALVGKTKELGSEKKKMDELLYQMVPRPVAQAMKVHVYVDIF